MFRHAPLKILPCHATRESNRQHGLRVFILTTIVSINTREHFVPITLQNATLKLTARRPFAHLQALNAEDDRALQVSITLFSHFGLCAYYS